MATYEAYFVKKKGYPNHRIVALYGIAGFHFVVFMSGFYLLIPRLLTGVVTISRALRKQRRARRMSSSFLSQPQFWSGADPPPPQFCAKEVAAST